MVACAFTFTFLNIPTNAFLLTWSRRQYVDAPTAIAENLTYATLDTFILRADDQAVLDPNGPGRKSVRLLSNQAYTTHVAVFVQRQDIFHPMLTRNFQL